MRLAYQFQGQTVKVKGGWGHTVSAEPGGHTACYILSRGHQCVTSSPLHSRRVRLPYIVCLRVSDVLLLIGNYRLQFD